MPTDFSKADKLVNATIKAGLNELGNDVKRRAMVLAPYAEKRPTATFRQHLRETGKVDTKSGGDVVYISFNTPYANRRHWENNLHPETKHYLTRSLASTKNIGRYFKPFN